MAVTYIQQPASGSIQSSDDPILFVFSSTQTAQPNFCFIVETLYNGVVVATDMVFPERSSRAHIDVSSETLSRTPVPGRTYGQVISQTLPTVQVKVYERYGLTPTTYTGVLSNVCKLQKASTDEETFKYAWLADKYTPSQKWLTDVPNSTSLVSRKYPMWASILNTDPDVTLELTFYNLAGAPIHVWTSAVQPFGDRVDVNLQPDIMNSILGGVALTLEDVYEIHAVMNNSDPMIFRFVDEECGEFHQLSWVNNLGTYDQFLFTHNRDQESAVVSMEFKKQFGYWNSLNLFVYDDLNSGDTVYSKVTSPTGSVYSGWIDQEYRNWLNQILNSIDVRLYQPGLPSDPTIPIVEKLTVTDTKAVTDKTRFNDTLNFQVNYKKTNFKSITQ